MISPVEWKNGCVRLLDQQALPHSVTFFDCVDYQVVAQAIKDLRVRGAPAIGIAAAMGVALGAQMIKENTFDAFSNSFFKICDHLAATRPTAVNLFWAINQMKAVLNMHRNSSVVELKAYLIAEACRILEEDVEMNRAIGRHGSTLLVDGQTVMTHCNAGALATGGYGTALGVVRAAWDEGKKISVIAGETRPVLQGARLTVWELQQDKIPVMLITDNMAGTLMRQGRVQVCVVGADRIAVNGDVVNKIGTYSLAVLARAHGVPFYVAAPRSTIDSAMASGDGIPIEERDTGEVANVLGMARITPENTEIYNPAFDMTPADLITGIITERGIFCPEDLARGMLEC
mgnify:CR=1 FL=1